MRLRIAVVCCCFALTIAGSVYGQGIFLPAGGAVNRGMGGATTGTAIESIGSMYWNPATISNLPSNELAFGFEAIYSNYSVTSTFPGAGSGFSEGEAGVTPVPTIAWVHHTDNPDVTLGLGVFGVAGFGVNVRGDATNPIVSPPFAQGGAGVGGIRSEATFFQLNPAVSVRMNDKLTIAAGPVIGLGKITLDDNVFASPNANGLYPRGDGTRFHWGLGAQIGFHYVHNCDWEFGANVKTPTWFEPFRYFSEDATGNARTDTLDVTLPLIVSGGVAYKGRPGTTLTADIRYLNYADTEALGTPAAYRGDASVSGLGFRDQFALAMGAQFEVNERLMGRIGYIYASDLINDSDTFFNIASELSYRHIPTVGATYHLSEGASVSVAYNYLIEFGSTGPYVLPGVGPVAGSSITTALDVHILTVGVNVRY